MKPSSAQEARAAGVIAEKQITLAEYLETLDARDRGKTCEPEWVAALNEQTKDVARYCLDLRWHTLAEISTGTGHPEASVSARLRDIRKYLRKGDKGDVIRSVVPGHSRLHQYAIRL